MNIDKDFERIKQGFKGEEIIRNYLSSLPNCIYSQADIIAKINSNWYCFEVKHQEIFESPPFDGHGLPLHQVRFRIKLFNERNIIPYLIVVDKRTNIVYYNSILELEKGKKFTTQKVKRVIYPIENFLILNP